MAFIFMCSLQPHFQNFVKILISQINQMQNSPKYKPIEQITIPVRGYIVVRSHKNEKKSSNIEIKADQRILYHCYKRYKSFIFGFDGIYTLHDLHIHRKQHQSAKQSLKNGHDYLLFCIGSAGTELDSFCEGTSSREGIFYAQLAPAFKTFVKSELMKMKAKFFIVTDDQVYDLVSQKPVELRQNGKQLIFHQAGQLVIDSLYQLYDSLKYHYEEKKRNLRDGHFIVFVQLDPYIPEFHEKRKMAFVQFAHEDNKSLLNLHQCVLTVHKKGRENGCFRNSKLTRILKPFLIYNSKVDVFGLVNDQENDPTYSTLSIVRDFSKVRVPADFHQNPLNADSKKKNENIFHIRGHSKQRVQTPRRIRTETQQITSKVENFGKAQFQLRKQLRKIRNNIAVMKNTSLLRNKNPQESLQDSLKLDDIEFYTKKEMKLQKQLQSLQLKKNSLLELPKTQADKLKIMKRYFTLEIENKRDETQEILQEMEKIRKIYEQKVRQINLKLQKKSINWKKNIQVEDQEPNNTHNKRADSLHYKQKERKFPLLFDPRNRRRNALKSKIKKGRVELSQFFEEKVQKYQQY